MQPIKKKFEGVFSGRSERIRKTISIETWKGDWIWVYGFLENWF
jgi:hypothetical protein